MWALAAIGMDHLDPERKLLDDVVDEIDGVLLIVPVVDFKRSDARGIIELAKRRRTLLKDGAKNCP